MGAPDPALIVAMADARSSTSTSGKVVNRLDGDEIQSR
jgi:hypothetical protein